MGRRRRRINQHLPKYVYRKGAGYIYRRHGKDTYLCKQTDPPSVLWAAYERVTAPQDAGTLRWLVRTYLDSEHCASRSERTREAYKGYADKMLAFKTAGGFEFGDSRLEDITHRTINGYLRKYGHPIAANRHVQFLSAAWNQVLQEHDIPANPVKGATYNEQKPRTRYVTDDEFAEAKALATGYLPVMMELAYLLRARRGEITALRHSDLLPEGVQLHRSKGSEGEITAWSDRLRSAVDQAKAIHPQAPSPIGGTYLLHDKAGQPVKKNAFDSAWQRLMKKWAGEPFTFHDLKAKGITDQRDNWGGHRSGKMRKVYVRQLPVIEPPG